MGNKQNAKKISKGLILLLLSQILWLCLPSFRSLTIRAQAKSTYIQQTTYLFLPIITSHKDIRKVNIPYFDGSVQFNQTAIFWFGKVSPTDTYTDVRMGYTQSELYVRLAIFDRLLWYDPDHISPNLTNYDSASLFLNLNGDNGSTPSKNSYRFDAQLNDWETRGSFWQAAFQGNGSGWTPLPNSIFTTGTGYRWESSTVGGINNNQPNRGWILEYHIPFTRLGLSTYPLQNSIWGIGLAVHNRDTSTGPPQTDEVWPETFSSTNPSTWGQLNFGIPGYAPPLTVNQQQLIIRKDVNGASTIDGMVGGSSVCGSGLDFWTQWGAQSYTSSKFFNIQNQGDVADWPCYSKYYVTFPLDVIPIGKVIVSAKLILHQFGNAGEPGQATPSYIQVMRVSQDWNVNTLSWNNSPLASENYTGTWVNPMSGPIVWPGVPYEWDISRAVADAYRENKPLRLVLYESDWDYHSGKYFVSENEDDWNKEGRPAIQVSFGDPAP